MFKKSSIVISSIVISSILNMAFERPAYAQGAKSNKQSNSKKKNSKSNKKVAAKEQDKSKQTIGQLLQTIDNKQASRPLLKSLSSLPSSEPVRNAAPKNISSIKPPSTRKLMRSADKQTEKYEKALEKSIDELYKLTQKYRKSTNRGELWLRLGELYVEKAKILEFRIYEQYDAKLKDFYDGKTKTKPELNLDLSKQYNKKAITLYEWFIKDFPKDDKMDQALFFLGYNYFQLNENTKGSRYYDQLVKEHPRSPFVAESYFSLGEHYFEIDNFKLALENYDAVINIKNSRLYPYALYKKAWCLYRTKRVPEGLRQLEEVVRYSRAQGADEADGKNNKIRLTNEAVRDMVPFYAVAGDPKKAKDYFYNYAGEKFYLPLVESLGYFYIDLAKRSEARYIFTMLINAEPMSLKAPDWQYQIVSVYSTGGDPKVYYQELKKWIVDYSEESEWYNVNKENQAAVASSTGVREKFLRNHILTNHKTFQNTKSKNAQLTALVGYTLFVKYFPESSYSPEMRFFFAELLYDSNKFVEAAEQYNWVAENAKASPYHEKAVINSLLALEQQLPKTEELVKMAGDGTEPVEFPEIVKEFIKAGTIYAQSYPKSSRSLELKFRIARLHYAFRQYDKAEPMFRDIVKTAPKTEYAGYSATLILDILNTKKDYKGLAEAGAGLLSSSALQGTKSEAEVRDIVEKASFKQAQDLEADKDYLKSAKAFESFAQQNPKSSLVPVAYFNAAVNYERVGEIFLAIPFYAKVVQSNSGEYSKQVNSSILLQAELNKKVGRLEEAVQGFEAYAKRNPGAPEIENLHYNSAIIWEALGNEEKSKASYEAYHSVSKKADKNDVYFKIAKMYDRKKSYNESCKYYEMYARMSPTNADMSAEAMYRCGEIKEAQNQYQQARKWYSLCAQNHSNKKGRALMFAASSKFKLIQENYRAYVQLKIPNGPQQAKVLNQKVDMLGKLTDEYTKLIRMDSAPQVLAALNYTARANEHFVDAILAVPLPSGLSEEESKQYRAGIENVVAPKRTAAIDLFKKTIEKSQELDTYTQDSLDAYNSLSKYFPQDYIKWQDFMISEAKLDLGAL